MFTSIIADWSVVVTTEVDGGKCECQTVWFLGTQTQVKLRSGSMQGNHDWLDLSLTTEMMAKVTCSELNW